MSSSLSLVVAPTAEPITVVEAKRHLRLDTTDGEPAPTAPTVALAGAGAGNVDNGAHRYLATFVTADGETDAGAWSAVVTVANKTSDGKVQVSAIPVGGGAVTARKLYRTVAGGAVALLVTTIVDNSTTTYLDSTADSGLGAQAPTSNTTLDPTLTTLVAAVRERAEAATGRQLLTATWDLRLDTFPCGVQPFELGLHWSFDRIGNMFLDIPRPPLQSVSSITYIDTAGQTQTWSSANYVVDAPSGPRGRRGRIAPAYGVVWPFTQAQINAATVRFVAGYGATGAAVPALLRQAQLMDLAALYENREAVVVSEARASAIEVPMGAAAIYRAHRTYGQARR
jgi:uncharacterized phiE125 gp8 family phage protein